MARKDKFTKILEHSPKTSETVPKLISQLKLNTQNQKMGCLHEKNRNVI
jgi:hypothetical protein